MKKSAYVILFLLLSVPASAQYGFQSSQDFSSFICNYYSNPQPERIVSSLKYYVNAPYKHANSIMMAQFYAVLLKEDTGLLKILFDEPVNNKSVQEKLFIVQVLAGISTPESSKYLARIKNEWRKESVQDALRQIKLSKPSDVFVKNPTNTADLDRLWAIFWATGNSKAISRIISVLYLWEEGRGAKAALGGAAEWSLTKYAALHPKILLIVQEERDHASGTQKRLLQEIIDKADQK